MKKVLSLLAVLFLGSVFLCTPAQATSLDLIVPTSGLELPPGGDAPWLTASFVRMGDSSVTLTLKASTALSSGVYVDAWYFNFNGALDVGTLSFTRQSGLAAASVTPGEDAYRLSQGGDYDIKFTWDKKTFLAGIESVYLISSTSPFNPGDFDFLSTPDNNGSSYYSEAKLAGISYTKPDGSKGTASTFIAAGGTSLVPEPATMLLLGSGLIGLAVFGRKRFLKGA